MDHKYSGGSIGLLAKADDACNHTRAVTCSGFAMTVNASAKQIWENFGMSDARSARNLELAMKALSYRDKNPDDRSFEDFQPFFDLLDDNVVFRGTYPEWLPIGGEYVGKESVIGYMARHSDVVDSWRREGPLEYFGHGDRVVALGAESYRVKKSGVTVNNRELATVFDFRDGLICSVLVVKDVSEVAAAYRED